jgi:hypothetical protein
VHARRYLVRVFSGGLTKLSDENPDINLLAKGFDLAEGEHSVYEVADGEEECLAVAAHKLTDPKKSPDAVSVLRIDVGDLAQFGITVDQEQFGTTGVPRWDCRHRNLLANRDQLIDLVRFLLEQIWRGHDQARRIEKPFVVRALNRICNDPPCRCPDHVKHIIGWCLAKDKTAPPTLSLPAILEELQAVEFDDEVIRPGADRLRSGDAIGDWFSSLNTLRRSYAQHYVPAIVDRFRLREASSGPCGPV